MIRQKRYKKKSPTRRTVIIVCGVLLAALGILSVIELTLEARDYRVVVARTLNVRQDCSGESPSIGILYGGEQVQILQYSDTPFVRVVNGEGLEGWCSTKYLRKPGLVTALLVRYVSPPSKAFHYTVEDLERDLKKLEEEYPQWVQAEECGRSLWGESIWKLTLGNPQAEKCIMVQGGIHAREYATAKLTVDMAENLLKEAENHQEYTNGTFTDELLAQTRIEIIPLCNPDGAMLCQNGISAAPEAYKDMLLAMNRDFTDFSRWKANGRGVDLNSNFDARWQPHEQYTVPGSSGYRGEQPFSEPESILLRDLILQEDPDILLCYHSSGRIIYWYFGQGEETLERDERIAQQLAQLTGYQCDAAAEPIVSVGGTKDWFVEAFQKPGFTLEVFDSSVNPPTEEMIDNEKTRHMKVLPYLLGLVNGR